MIKSNLVSLLVLLIFVLAYNLDIFGLFANNYALFIAIGLIIAVVIAGFIILGNPFLGDKRDDENDEK